MILIKMVSGGLQTDNHGTAQNSSAGSNQAILRQ